MADEEDEDGPPKTRAELMLQHLLDRQLATSGRLEQVEFKGATKGLYRGIQGSGVSTLAEFRAKKEQSPEPERLQDEEKEKCKRRRYGPDPAFISREQIEQAKQMIDQASAAGNHLQRELGRHEKELELSLIKGKSSLQAIAHLAVEGVSFRKPLTELSEIYKGTTPQERARAKDGTRSTQEVFSASAPSLLDLRTYLENGATPTPQETHALEDNEHSETMQVPEETIIANRLSLAEIQEWSDGKFRTHAPGAPSNALYLKNLSSEVTEEDLVALFLRYQKPGSPVGFRLMQKGRMKGQAFVTFSDVETATLALQLVDGYMLKGKPMIIEYARGTLQKD